jgi:hypothetical protein
METITTPKKIAWSELSGNSGITNKILKGSASLLEKTLVGNGPIFYF